MANHYFQFKQFKVEQHGAAMKVGTDGVLLGAWVPLDGARRILDIGTGTGLLALMMAQRNESAFIDAIEIDKDASVQAEANARLSPWSTRITVVNCALQEYARASGEAYDLIVCNPPFFSNSLKSPHLGRSLARHNVSLTLDELVACALPLLTHDGKMAVVLPTEQYIVFEKTMRGNGFSPKQILEIMPVAGKEVKRILSVFDRSDGDCLRSTLVVEIGGRHQYSENYKDLTKDFYLAF